MRLTSTMLRRIIAEEMQKMNNRQIVAEGTVDNPVRVTPAYINRLIKEELETFQRQQRLAESRRRRVRARRLAEERRRARNSYSY
jgi:hypothetical protein